jgi:adenylate cyclase
LVLVHANLVNNVLAGDYARRVPGWAVFVAALILGHAGLAMGLRRTVSVMATFGVLSLALFVAAAYVCWIKFSLWLPLTWPILGFTVLQFVVISRRVLREQRARDQVKQMFGTYLSPQLVNRMIESGETPRLGGHEEEITAYFSDIEGFSRFSEQLSPERLVDLMNEYLTACTDIVQEEGGTLDKYIGDAVVAMFGAPVAQSDHAYRACLASQRVQARLRELRAQWRAEGQKWPEIVCRMQTRIGLNSGHCIIGNMGSRTRFNYTMMGDNVNLAARMESGAKKWGVYSMTTEATKVACERHGGDRIVFRALGRVRVVGRSQAVPIYEVMGLRESLEPSVPECIGLFEEGLTRYFARDWDGAIAKFGESARLEAGAAAGSAAATSNPSLIYARIAEHCRAEPPAEHWDGVYAMQEK